MSDFGEQAWEEGFEDENEYLDHLMDEMLDELHRSNEYDPPFEERIKFSNNHIREVRRCGEKYAFIDSSDNKIAEFDFIGECKYQFVKVMNNNKWGFFDSWECKASEIIYEEVGDFLYEKRNIDRERYLFDNALLPVKLNGLWGFLDVQMNEVIPCEYNEYKNLIFVPYSFLQGMTIDPNREELYTIINDEDPDFPLAPAF